MTKEPATYSQLRSFGLIVGSIFLFIAIWPFVVRHQDARWWAFVPALVLIAAALIKASALKPIHKVWMQVGYILGWVNTRIILAIGFFGILLPVGLTMRLLGKDPMRRRTVPGCNSYRLTRTPRPGLHMRQQF